VENRVGDILRFQAGFGGAAPFACNVDAPVIQLAASVATTPRSISPQAMAPSRLTVSSHIVSCNGERREFAGIT
jgi:hypothetical protein